MPKWTWIRLEDRQIPDEHGSLRDTPVSLVEAPSAGTSRAASRDASLRGSQDRVFREDPTSGVKTPNWTGVSFEFDPGVERICSGPGLQPHSAERRPDLAPE